MKVGDFVCCIKDRTFRELPDGRDKRHLYYKKGNYYKILSVSDRIVMTCETKNNNMTYKVFSFKDFDNYFADGQRLRKIKLEKINVHIQK